MSCLFVANAQNPSWNSSVSTILTDNIQSEKFQQKIKVYKENIAFALTKECNSKYYIEELVDTQVSSNKVAIGVDSIFDMAILNEHIYFVGENNSVGFIGRVYIPHLQSGNGSYELTSTSSYTIRTIKTYNDSNGKQHVVGIGESGSNHSLFFDFNDVNTPNFELKVIRINNQKALYDLDVTDKYIAVIGIYATQPYDPTNTQQTLIRILRDNTSSVQGVLFNHTGNVDRLMPDSHYEKMLVRHTFDDEVVIMTNAYDIFYNFSTLLNCVNLSNLPYIHNVQSIKHEQKDMKIRDAVFDKETKQMLIVEDCSIPSFSQNRKLSYIMHSQPYLQVNYTLHCYFDNNNFTFFNAIDNLRTNRYIVSGVPEQCMLNMFFIKDMTMNTNTCADYIKYDAIILNPISAYYSLNINTTTINANWTSIPSSMNSQIDVICY